MQVAFYKSVRPEIQGLYSRAVRSVDKGPYSHCEIVFSDGFSGSASYIDGGVRLKRIVYDNDNWDFVELPDHLEKYARQFIEKIIKDNESAPKEKRAGYDLMGNLRFIAWMVRESPKDWFCNEICGAAIQQTDPWRHGPNGFHGYCVDIARAFNTNVVSSA